MPPKIKVTREEIVQTGVDLLKEKGQSAINARSIAKELGCSTQPIFSNFSTMESLQSALLEGAYALYLGFLEREVETGKYPPYKAFGMAYIRFAQQEKELFKLLFMRDRTGEKFVATVDYEQSVALIMQANTITKEKAERMHFEMWAFVHGIATMLATSFIQLEWETISAMLTDVYQGLCVRYAGEKDDGCNKN